MKVLLFQSGTANTWFVIGFSAWLATFGQSGFAGRFGGSWPRSAGNQTQKPQLPDFSEMIDTISGMMGWIIAGGIVLLIVMIIITWISSRGKFMFLDNIVTNRARITAPWKEFQTQGNSLFLWRIGFGFIGGMTALPLVLVWGAMVTFWFLKKNHVDLPDSLARYVPDWIGNPALGVLSGLGVIAISWLIFVWFVNLLSHDFVIPAMYKHRTGVIAAWKRIIPHVGPNLSAIIRYAITKFLLGLCVGIAILVLGPITCCVAWIVLIIPYIGTVALLPVTIALQYFNLYFLRQLGPDLDLIAGENELTTFPVV